MPRTSKLLAIRGDRVLLAFKGHRPSKKGNRWNLLGGKANRGESPLACLRREVTKEEGPHLKLSRVRKWKTLVFKVGKKKFPVTVYLGSVSGKLHAGAEIDAIAWVRIKNLDRMHVSANTRQILRKFIASGYLKR